MTRRRLAALAGLAGVAAAQVALLLGYSAFRTTWHFLLHSTLGFAAGLAAAALLTAATRRPTRPLLAALAGQALSVAPDVMFRMLRMAHVRWMDVFVAHITVHTAPARLLTSTAAAVLASWAWWCTGPGGRRRTGVVLALSAVTLVGVGLALHTPIPTRLSDYYTRFYGV